MGHSQLVRHSVLAAGLLAWSIGSAAASELDAFVERAREADVVILGEVHDNPAHHANQARIVAALEPAALVFEMLGADQEAAANAQRADGAGRGALGAALAWEEGGWPDFEMYAPVFEAAPAARIYGGARPRDEVARSMSEGAAAVFGSDAAAFGLDRELAADEQARREEAMLVSHCNALPEEMLAGMVEAQRFRDAALAAAVLRARAETDGGQVVVITGNGHADRAEGIPAALSLASPGTEVLALAQIEAPSEGADPERFDAYLVAPPPDREDPCAVFEQRG